MVTYWQLSEQKEVCVLSGKLSTTGKHIMTSALDATDKETDDAKPGLRRWTTRTGSFVQFTVINECSMNAAMPLNLSKSSNQPNQRFADTLLAFSLLGLMYPHHLIQATGRHHANIRYSHGIQKNNDDYWYMPARSPAFDDLLGS
jgi:hypothetical protein